MEEHFLWIAESKNYGKNINTRSQEPVSRAMDGQVYSTTLHFRRKHVLIVGIKRRLIKIHVSAKRQT